MPTPVKAASTVTSPPINASFQDGRMEDSSTGLDGDNADHPYTILCICQGEWLATGQEFPPATGDLGGVVEECAECWPPEGIVGEDGESKRQRKQPGVQAPEEADRAQRFTQHCDHDQMPVAKRV